MQTCAPARLLGWCFLISNYSNICGYKLALKMSLIFCLYIPGLRHLDDHFVWRGFPRLPRTARDPRPGFCASGLRAPVVGFSILPMLFPSESAEAILDPAPGLLVVCTVLVHLPRNLQCHRGSGLPPRGDRAALM